MSDLRESLERLTAAAESGELHQLCERYRAELLVAFGSTVRGSATPRDLDVAVLFSRELERPDVLGFLDELGDLARTMNLDLMDLGRAGPVAREQALVGGLPLVQSTPDLFAREQMRAIMERLDTDWLRRLELELMAR